MNRNSATRLSDPAQFTRASASRDPPVPLCDLFKIGIGPSSSHTVGPMKAAALYLQHLEGHAANIHRLVATVYGSLAWTGKGHATDKALMLGLAGERADAIDPDAVEPQLLAMLPSRQSPVDLARWPIDRV